MGSKNSFFTFDSKKSNNLDTNFFKSMQYYYNFLNNYIKKIVFYYFYYLSNYLSTINRAHTQRYRTQKIISK